MRTAKKNTTVKRSEMLGCRVEDFPIEYQRVIRKLKILMRIHSAVWKRATQMLKEDAKIIREKRITKLPARISIDRIFEEFNAAHNPPSSTSADKDTMLLLTGPVQHEIQGGLLDLFNELLRPFLLHRSEHLQHDDYEAAEMTKAGVSFEKRSFCTCEMKEKEEMPANPQFEASEHYGVLHLFRFFSRLPHILVGARIRADCFELIYTVVFQLVSFILDNKEEYFDPKKDCTQQTAKYMRQTTVHHKVEAKADEQKV